jgi:threonylcarbamoyladenosine tRNA methylthiotransferase MtaB
VVAAPADAPTLRTVTLGCKVNQYETQLVREALHAIGYRDAPNREPATFCVVNTCTVTHEGDAKSRQAIRRLAHDNPGTRILVMGCYAARAPQELRSLPGVVEVVGDKRELADALGRTGVAELPSGIARFDGRRRAFVKVQDGCILRCTYCIIPQVRPGLTSRPPSQIVAEVRRLVANGYREIVLTGIHLGHYGVDFNLGKPKAEWVRLADLCGQLAGLAGDFRIRLSSLEATELTGELLNVMARHADRICPHLHVCLQSGSDRVLARMKRRWGSRRFVDRCQLAKRVLALPALTTDVIVGFPGESEDDFEATCAVAREVGFSRIHAFSFSARSGTEAAAYEGRVPPEAKADRLRRLAELESRLRAAYYAQLEGRVLDVLVESPIRERTGWVIGTSCRYAPVELMGTPDDRSRRVHVVAGGCRDGRVVASSRISGA